MTKPNCIALVAGASLMRVNDRDLKPFQVDLATTEQLAAKLCSSRDVRPAFLLVAESGIHAQAEVER